MSGETETSPSGWTVDTAAAHLQRQITMLATLLDERYATQTKAIDAAFAAQQLAMTTALQAAERAVQVANANAEKAVLKAELSSDKRFEAVNEFRSQLNDQSNTFATREQVELIREAINERLRETTKRIDMNTSRLDADGGKSAGISASWAVAVAVVAGLIGILGFGLAMLDMLA
jgi:hypothetical protein